LGFASLDYYVASPGAASTITYRIRFGPSANTGYINQDPSTIVYGASATSQLRIQELVGTIS